MNENIDIGRIVFTSLMDSLSNDCIESLQNEVNGLCCVVAKLVEVMHDKGLVDIGKIEEIINNTPSSFKFRNGIL